MNQGNFLPGAFGALRSHHGIKTVTHTKSGPKKVNFSIGSNINYPEIAVSWLNRKSKTEKSIRMFLWLFCSNYYQYDFQAPLQPLAISLSNHALPLLCFFPPTQSQFRVFQKVRWGPGALAVPGPRVRPLSGLEGRMQGDQAQPGRRLPGEPQGAQASAANP